MLITKTLRNAVAGAAVAGALVLPGAMTVAPQIVNSACQYPNSVATNTTISSQRSWDQGEVGKATVTVVSDAGVPNGDVRVKVVGPDRGDKGTKADTYFNSGKVPLPNDGTKGFDIPDDLRAGNYTIKAKFFGACKWMNSSDRFRFEVVKKKG